MTLIKRFRQPEVNYSIHEQNVMALEIVVWCHCGAIQNNTYNTHWLNVQ